MWEIYVSQIKKSLAPTVPLRKVYIYIYIGTLYITKRTTSIEKQMNAVTPTK